MKTIALFTPEELERLHQFVGSPIFNPPQRFNDTLKLFELLKYGYPSFDNPVYEKEKTAAALFPERKNARLEVEKAMAQLMKIVRYFITFQFFTIKSVGKAESERYPGARVDNMLSMFRQNVALMQFYIQRGSPLVKANFRRRDALLEKEKIDQIAVLFKKTYNEAHALIKAWDDYREFEGTQYTVFHFYKFLAEYSQNTFESYMDDVRKGDQNLLNTIERLDEFYLTTKLDLTARLLHRARQISDLYEEDPRQRERFDFNKLVTVEFVSRLQNEFKKIRSPHLFIYCVLIDFLVNQNVKEADKAAKKFKGLSKKNTFVKLLPATKINDYIIMMRAYFVSRYNQTKDLGFLELNFQIQVEQLKLLNENDGILSSHLQNLFFTALKLKKLELAGDLLQKFHFKRIVGEKHPELVARVLAAALRFSEGKFAEAESDMPHYLECGQLEDVYLYSIASTLNVKICYELNTLFDQANESLVHTTSTHIKRAKSMPADRKKGRLEFFRIAGNMYRIKEKMNRKGDRIDGNTMSELLADIHKQPVVEVEWLLEKLSELGIAATTAKTGNK